MPQFVKLKLIKYIRLHLKNVDYQLKRNGLNAVFTKFGEDYDVEVRHGPWSK